MSREFMHLKFNTSVVKTIVLADKLNELYLPMDGLVIYLSQHPVVVVVSREEDGVGLVLLLCPQALLDLDGNGHQLFAGVDIEKAERGGGIVVGSSSQAIHDLHVTDVNVTGL